MNQIVTEANAHFNGRKGIEKGVGSLCLMDSESLCSDEHGITWKRFERLASKARIGYMEPFLRVCQNEG